MWPKPKLLNIIQIRPNTSSQQASFAVQIRHMHGLTWFGWLDNQRLDRTWCEPRDHATHTQIHQFPESQTLRTNHNGQKYMDLYDAHTKKKIHTTCVDQCCDTFLNSDWSESLTPSRTTCLETARKSSTDPTVGLEIITFAVKLDSCAFYVRIWI
jgi:hypothetical protein